MSKIYAGIGARTTPPEILEMMATGARGLSQKGWSLRSGHAHGADAAFETEASKGEIHLPWSSYNVDAPKNHKLNYVVPWETPEIVHITSDYHPSWARLSRGVKSLMCRNTTVMLGVELNKPVDMVVCWTPDGMASGGTGHALRIAAAYKIKIFNLYWNADIDLLDRYIDEKKS